MVYCQKRKKEKQRKHKKNLHTVTCFRKFQERHKCRLRESGLTPITAFIFLWLISNTHKIISDACQYLSNLIETLAIIGALFLVYTVLIPLKRKQERTIHRTSLFFSLNIKHKR